MSRMKYLIIHCTATPEGREVTAADIKAWHTNPTGKGGRGWKQVGYTDLFKLDGTVERLVQKNEDANVDPWEVPNAGGMSRDGRTPKDTRTAAQLKAMEKYVKDFHHRFPGVKIIGHNRLAAKACPSFDVEEWLQSIGIRN